MERTQTIIRSLSAETSGGYRVWEAREIMLDETGMDDHTRKIAGIVEARDGSFFLVSVDHFWDRGRAITYLMENDGPHFPVSLSALDEYGALGGPLARRSVWRDDETGRVGRTTAPRNTIYRDLAAAAWDADQEDAYEDEGSWLDHVNARHGLA